MSKRKVRIDNGTTLPFYVDEDTVTRTAEAEPWWLNGWVIALALLILFLALGIPLTASQ